MLPLRSSSTVMPRLLRFAGEPLAQREIGGGPGESAIAAGGRFAADVEDRLPQGIEVRHRSPYSLLLHGDSDAALGSDRDGVLVAGVDVPDDAHARIVDEHPFELLRGQRRAVGDT